MKRVYITLAGLAISLTFVSVWRVAQPSEPDPLYKGRTLTRWLEDFAWQGGYDNPPSGTREAVEQLGTNAIPTLLRLIQLKDSRIKLKLMELLQHQHFITIKYIPASQWNYAAGWGFHLLRTNGQTAVPELIRIANREDPSCSVEAIMALGGVGPSAKQAVPFLSQLATNEDETVQRLAQNALLQIDLDAFLKAISLQASTKAGTTDAPPP